MTITWHKPKDRNIAIGYAKIGGYKIFRDDLMSVLIDMVGEEAIKAKLKTLEKDEWGYTVNEPKK